MATPIDPNARFERQKTLAKQESNAEAQQAKDALARRFAAMGRTNSGAAIKNEQQINRASNDALQKRLQSVQDAQDTEALRRQEIEEGRKFQTSEREASQLFARGEREGSQGFAADQARLGREFATSERLGSQNFASGEAQKGRDFSREERLGSQSFAADQAQLGRDFQHNENLYARRLQREAMSEQIRQFEKSFAEDQRVTNFNMDMARSEAGKKDILAKLGDLTTKGWKSTFGDWFGW